MQDTIARSLSGVVSEKDRKHLRVVLETIGDRGATIGAVSVHNGLRYYDVSLFARDDGMSIHENGSLPDGGSTEVAHTITPIPTRTWTRLVFDIDYGGPGALTPGQSGMIGLARVVVVQVGEQDMRPAKKVRDRRRADQEDGGGVAGLDPAS